MSSKVKDREIKFDEIAEHHKKGDKWLVMSGVVYDVTDFDHPGGLDILRPYLGNGKDA